MDAGRAAIQIGEALWVSLNGTRRDGAWQHRRARTNRRCTGPQLVNDDSKIVKHRLDTRRILGHG